MSIRRAFRDGQVFSTHAVLASFGIRGQTDVACLHACSDDPGREPATYVNSPSHRTDPRARDEDRGCKRFSGERAQSMVRALGWASRRYGVDEWAPCPMDANAMIPRTVREAALAYASEVARRAQEALLDLDATSPWIGGYSAGASTTRPSKR
jgi:hypothetical protein